MQRTALGNSPFHEAIVAELWELRGNVQFLIEQLQAEPEESLTTSETWLAADAQALGYLTMHFLSVFEGSIRGLGELRRQHGQPAAVDADDEDPGLDDGDEHAAEASEDHGSCCDAEAAAHAAGQAQAVIVKVCPWSVSPN
jgi:hypothetical protein